MTTSSTRFSARSVFSRRCVAFAAVALAALLLQGRASAAQGRCDRACLKGLINQYLSALAQHDPASLPVAASVRFTENGTVLRLGQGFWKTAGAAQAYRLYVLDPRDGAAAVQTIVNEGDHVALMMLRLKVEAGKISQVETIVVRKGDQRFFKPEVYPTLPDIYNQPVAAAGRNSREQLLTAADAYFTAIQTEGTAQYRPAPFADGMNRYENGVQTTNVSMDGQAPASAAEQLEKAIFKGFEVTDRRYPVVDVEDGTVLGIVTFRGGPPPRKTTLLLSEIFKVTGGQIRQIRAVMLDLPLNARTGWN